MSTLSPQAQVIINAFGQEPGVTQDHLNNLQAAINASSALIDQINGAVAQGHLRAIMPLTNPNAGGQYDPDPKKLAMELPLSKLTTPPPGPDQSRQAALNAGEITFVLGHELQHGFNRIATRQALTDFANGVRQIAKHDPAPRDYTAPTASLLAQNRRDEAGAEIAGWNAIVSRLKSANPNSPPSLQDIYLVQPGRMADFVDQQGTNPNYTYTLKPNLTLNPDMTLSTTPANVEAMGQNYFDKQASAFGGPVRLGHHGNSDYVNHYGRSPVSFIAQTERHYHPPQPGVAAPQMGLNLSQLRLSERLLEENGVDLGKHPQPLPYYDFGNQPPMAHLFQHTKTTHQHVSPIAAEVLEAELVRERSQRSSSLSDQQRRIPPSGDPIVDRWIDALQDGDYATAKAVQREFANSPEGQRLWTDTLAEARAEEARQQPWLAQARDTSLYNQALEHLDRLGPQMGLSWTREQREQLAGTIALEAKRGHLPEIDALVPTRDGTLVAVWNSPNDRIFDRRTGAIDPAQAAEQPLQQSMQQFKDEAQRQERQAILDAQQRQRQEQQRGMSM